MERQKWVDHTFNLNLHPGWAQNVISRLEDTEVRLAHHCKGLNQGQLTYQPDGGWSIKEQIGHLIDLEPLHIARLQEFQAMQPELSPADMSNTMTEAADHNTPPLQSLIETFAAGRRHFIEVYHSLPGKSLNHQALHPRLKVLMRPVDLLFFVAEHDDHHLTSLIEIKRELSK